MEKFSHKIYTLAQKAKYTPRIVLLGLTLAGATGAAGCGDHSLTFSTNNSTKTLPTPTPNPNGETPPSNSSQNDTKLNPGDCTLANSGDFVEGDVNINGQWTTDNAPNTGQIIIMQAPGDVCAPFGADIQRNVLGEGDNGAATLRRDISEMKSQGCVNGCATVLVNFWPSGNPANP